VQNRGSRAAGFEGKRVSRVSGLVLILCECLAKCEADCVKGAEGAPFCDDLAGAASTSSTSAASPTDLAGPTILGLES
jgi:hypothetical protein